MTDRIKSGLDILYREASSTKHRTWEHYEFLKNKAREHIESCGEDWPDYAQEVCTEIAERLQPIG